ncbi:MAG: helicase-related protein, partial [Bacteroidales bacterium]|nr:helicase-related protein [Bacteroidales bacterium]
RESLKCHYCEYSRRFTTICTKCGKPGLKEKGCGTEMIEEQIGNFFPEATVDRLDAETTSSKIAENKILSNFATGKTDILVGTQMVSKGFDFANLTLIILVQADSMFAVEDFRATEKAMQMLIQLAGRGGRRETQGHIMIQTSQPNHRIYHNFLKGEETLIPEIKERKEFEYPPFTRLIKIVLKSRDKHKLNNFALKLTNYLPQWGVQNFNGPFPPTIDWIKGEHILHLWIKLNRNQHTQTIKSTVFASIEAVMKKEGKGVKIHFDVDPL